MMLRRWAGGAPSFGMSSAFCVLVHKMASERMSDGHKNRSNISIYNAGCWAGRLFG